MSLQNEPIWLRRDVVLAIHEAQIAQHGGALGVRDESLLESALARPQNAFAYGETQPAKLGALYALGVIQNHPFLDGNKRVGLVLLETFLELNGAELHATDEECYSAIVAAAAGKISERDFFAWVTTKS